MSLQLSDIVSVDISVAPVYPEQDGFGTLLVVTNDTSVIGIAERTRYYTGISGVAADWDTSSELYKAANSYFSQSPRPTSFIAGVRFDESQAAQLRGGSVTDLSLFTVISDGSFSVSIDGDQQDITGLDFSSDITFADIAETIENGLQGIGSGGFTSASCSYVGSRFIINTGSIGDGTTISFASTAASGTDISSILEMQQGEGTKTNGIDAETITESLVAIEASNDSFYGFQFTKEVRDDVIINGEDAVIAAAAYAESRVKVFFNTSNDLDVLDAVTTNDILSQLRDSSYTRTISTFSSYPNEYVSASVAGRAFTVNFDQSDSTITLKFKQLPSITVESITPSQKAVLDSKNGNALVSYGGVNMYAESYMADGTFFDERHGLDWLTNAIQTGVFGYIYGRDTKVPYTNAGAAAIEQQLRTVLDTAVDNGLLAAGTLSDGTELPFGYEVYVENVEDQSQSDIEARFFQGITFVAKGAGAIHRCAISGSFQR